MADEELVFDEQEDVQVAVVPKAAGKAGHSGAHATGFKDFLLKPEILRAIQECGFEHPSDVQQECIPQAVLGQDVLCQAKPGMGKTAVFVISTLQQLKPVDGECSVLVLCHTRELAFQIHKEYERFAKFFEPAVKSAVFFGGIKIDFDKQKLRENHPHIVIGTPGRVSALVKDGWLKLGSVKHFVLDECDKMIGQPDMRATVQEIFKATPHSKQVMMFSATLPTDIRPICKKFMHNALEVFVDDDAKLVLKELKQHYVRLEEKEKNRKLFAILDGLQFNQVIIFVKSVQRCQALEDVLAANMFPVTSIHGGKRQEDRLKCYNAFKTFEKRVLVATDVFGRGMDIERVNIVFNYDLPDEETLVGKTDTYLHRVARAGRFGTKGLAISFLASDADVELLNEVKVRFNIEIDELPETLEADTYIQNREK